MNRTTIYDSSFVWGQHALHSSGDRTDTRPSHVAWLGTTPKLGPYKGAAPVWFTDGHVSQTHLRESKAVRIGWLLEPFELHPENYEMASNALERDRIDVLITSDPERFPSDKDVRVYAHGGTRIHSSDWLVWKNKRPRVSIVASPKRSLPGHEMRHQVIARLGDKIDAYGADYEPIDRKIEALSPYMFSIAIENVKRPFWFTEALLDCFLTGTVPIYWGTNKLTKWGFDPRGVIECNDVGDVLQSAEHVTYQDYQYRMPFIETNLHAALQYTCTEDWMWRKWPELFAPEVLERETSEAEAMVS